MATYTLVGGTQVSPLTPDDIPYGITPYANLRELNEPGAILNIGDGVTETWFDDSGWFTQAQYNTRIYVKANVNWISGTNQNGKNERAGQWLFGTSVKLFIESNSNTLIDWRGLTVSYDSGDASGNYIEFPLVLNSLSYVDFYCKQVYNAVGGKVSFKTQGIQKVNLNLHNTILQVDDSSTQLDNIVLNGSNNSSEDTSQVFGNTVNLTINNLSPISPIPKIGSIYGGETDSSKKDFYLNNPVMDPTNILMEGKNFDVHINNDISLIIDQVSSRIAYKAGTLDTIAASNENFTINDIYRAYRITEQAGYLSPDSIFDNRQVKFWVAKFGFEKIEFEEFINTNGPFVKTVSLKAFEDNILNEVDSLAVSGVKILFNKDYAENGLLWDYTLDCGGNQLTDVHDFLYAMQLQTTNYFDKMGVEWWHMIRKDGDAFKSVWDGLGSGVRVINYGGKLNTMQSNTAETFTPFVYSNLTLTNLIQGTEVRIYETSTMNEIGGTETTGTTYTYQYTWSGTDTPVTVVVYHLKYNPIRFETTLIEGDASTPVTQLADRVYYNPPAPYLKTNTFETGKNNNRTITLLDIVKDSTYDDDPFNPSEISGLSVNNDVVNGTFVDNGDNTYTYSPNTDYLGGDNLSFTPIYNVLYEGVTTPGMINFDVALFSGLGFENLIILGDSIMARVFDNGSVQDWFTYKHKELYNKDINVYGEAVSGWNSQSIVDNIDTILGKYSNLDPLKTMVFLAIGTNNIYSTRLEGTAANQDERQAIYDDILFSRDRTESYNFTFVQGEIPFLVFDTGVDADTVYKKSTNEILHEDLGSYDWNFASKGEIEAASVTSPSFMVTDGTTNHTIDQAYNYARQWRKDGFEDSVHPNYIGRMLYQQALLDTLMLYNAYGKKPFMIDNTFNHQIIVNISDSTVVPIDAYSRTSNTYDINNGLISLNYNDLTASPFTIEIIGGSLIDSGIDMLRPDQYIFNEYLQKGLKVLSGSSITITISGLTVNEIYKFQAIGSFKGTGLYTGIMRDGVLNRSSKCKANEDSSNEANINRYYDFTLIPQTTTQVLTLEPDVGEDEAYINAIQFWHLASGN